jgi:hypothetical protein
MTASFSLWNIFFFYFILRQISLYLKRSTRFDWSYFGGQSDNIFEQRKRVLFKDITLPTNLKISSISHDFGFVRMFHNFSKSYYYLVSINRAGLLIYTNTSVISRNLCKNVSEIFNKTILNEYSYLKRLKFYHLPCKVDELTLNDEPAGHPWCVLDLA